MSKKTLIDMVNSLKKENFNFNFFEAETIGDYLPEDSDWNYKDVAHAKYVHSNVSSYQAFTLDDMAASVNQQKLPFIGMSIPVVTINYEISKFNQMYFFSIGPFVVIVNTISTKINLDKTKVKTSYAVGSKGLFKYLHKIIGKILLRNYKLLMTEDAPMRIRKGQLRKSGHKFYSDNKSSFKFSAEINRANVYLNKNEETEMLIKKSTFLTLKHGDTIGKSSGILNFFITEEENLKKIWPSTCSHEGALLSSKCIKKSKIFCPWHNKVVNPIIIIDRDKNNIFKILQCEDYKITDDKETINIKFRNDPEYYNKNY